MYIKNLPLRIIGIIGAVLLSILLVVMLIAAPLYSVTASLIKPNTLVDIATGIDYSQILLSDDAVQDAIDEEGMSDELLQELVNSTLFRKTIETYSHAVTATLRGETAPLFDEATLKTFAREHTDELTALVRQFVPEAADHTDAEVEEAVGQLVDQYSATVVEALPSAEEVMQLLQESSLEQPIKLLVDTTVPVVLYGVVILLAGLIFACLLHRFGGLLCLGIDALIAVLPLALIYILLTGGPAASLLGDTEATAFLLPLLSVIAGKVLTGVILLAVLGILLIAGYIVYSQLVFKKKYAVAPAIVEAPATE